MNNNVKRNTGRKYASLLMLFTCTLLIPSGIMMHMNDAPGLSSSRHIAMVIHNLSALLFVISGLFHIKNNFSLIKKYIYDSCFFKNQ